MAPAVRLKRSATQTITLPPPDARLAVRDVMRSTIPSRPAEAPASTERPAPAAALQGFLCLEEVDGRRWSYVVDGGSAKGRGSGGVAVPAGASVRAVPLQSPLPPAEEIMSFIRSYVVPEGFPDSVTPSYVPYMNWRALKHFFGGAMGVFTTRTLLGSVGVSQSKVIPGAIAINWILKDGAGRVGKMLFARQGKKFDNDLKQLRFSSDLLLEIGAGIELTTAAFPQFFLPMACVANVVKNVAAVTSTSTRTPIYKAYARGENIGDVTAKGESVGNIADLVRSVVLNTLNRARFTVAVDSFIKTGHIPSLKEGNSQETIFNPPWRHETVAIGSRFGEAFQEPASFLAIRPLFEDERYMVTYNPTKDKVYALLKDQAKSDDIIKAAFHAHVLLHFINASHARRLKLKQKQANPERSEHPYSRNVDFLAHIAESCKIVSSSYGTFKKKAREQGWIMSESLLNPGKARLCAAKPQ
ncbi:Protein root UVB sensitive 6 [Zea mays]|uniref:Protein root UVB sensitive 6 n=1 Tax=Zea mays TaxID=4577 RepID=A0A3L6DL29_MAIZE|nr:Protein root UVB sensitive 6 [Zea mays]